jgi:hypothetical protein
MRFCLELRLYIFANPYYNTGSVGWDSAYSYTLIHLLTHTPSFPFAPHCPAFSFLRSELRGPECTCAHMSVHVSLCLEGSGMGLRNTDENLLYLKSSGIGPIRLLFMIMANLCVTLQKLHSWSFASPHAAQVI